MYCYFNGNMLLFVQRFFLDYSLNYFHLKVYIDTHESANNI